MPVLLCGLLLLWTVAGYVQHGATGLMALSAAVVLLAVASPRPLPSTARAVVWVGVLLAIFCLSANLDRITPAAPGQERDLVGGFDAYPYDRAATIALGLGLTALLFRPARVTVTVVGVGSLPMLMMAMERAREHEGWAAEKPFVWVGLGLLALAAQAQCFTRPRSSGLLAAGRHEWLVRAGLPLLLLGVAALTVAPVTAAARTGRDWLYAKAGLRISSRTFSGRSDFLSMGSPPPDFSGRIRPLLEIQSPLVPGYLREATYHAYTPRQWSGRALASRALMPVSGAEGTPDVRGGVAYAVGEGALKSFRAEWIMRPLQPRRLPSLCLPGGARIVVLPEGMEPRATADGIVSLETGLSPSAYRVQGVPGEEDAAYPWPDPAGSLHYLALPEHLASAVSNWVLQCEGLAGADDADAAIGAVVSHFHRKYRYRLGKPRTRGDPLEGFMNDREGHCTWFASAAALMLRSVGIPTRVVGGFLCTELHRFTGRWVVRERDGHAWCEAWDEAAGRWRLVEATPPGGLPGLAPPPGRVRLLWEVAIDAWRRFVERIRTSNPLLALAEGVVAVWFVLQEWFLSPWGIGFLAAGGVLMAVRWRRRRRRDKAVENASERLRTELVRAMSDVERRVVRPTSRRRPNEPWSDWLPRVSAELSPAQASHLGTLLEAYQSLRYQSQLDHDRVRFWLSSVDRRGRSQSGDPGLGVLRR